MINGIRIGIGIQRVGRHRGKPIVDCLLEWHGSIHLSQLQRGTRNEEREDPRLLSDARCEMRFFMAPLSI